MSPAPQSESSGSPVHTSQWVGHFWKGWRNRCGTKHSERTGIWTLGLVVLTVKVWQGAGGREGGQSARSWAVHMATELLGGKKGWMEGNLGSEPSAEGPGMGAVGKGSQGGEERSEIVVIAWDGAREPISFLGPLKLATVGPHGY